MPQRVTVSIHEHIADVRLNRAEKLNALDTEMFAALLETGERLRQENAVRAVVLSGEGKAFSAGLDMQSFERMRAGLGLSDIQGGPFGCGLAPRTFGSANAYQHAALLWRELPMPVIAAVHGAAFGGGLQLALGADIRYVAPDARLALAEIKWGFVPDMAGFLLLRGLVRGDEMRELVFSGRQFSGEEAMRLGLATEVHDDPRAAALAFAERLTGLNPDALRAAKRLANLAAHADAATVLQAESDEQGKLIGSPNQIEAIAANLEKRAANFRDGR